MENFPEGKFLTTVKIGPKGQIVIPKEIRDMFSLNTGDSLLLMADKGQGIAIFPDLLEETEQGKARQLKVFYVLSMRKEVSLSLGKIFLKRK